MIGTVIYLTVIFSSALIGLLNFKKSDKPFRLLTLLLLLTFISEAIATLLQYTTANNSLPEKIYTPLHIAFFTGIYYTLVNRLIFKKVVMFCGFILFIIAVITILTLKKAELPAYIIMGDSIMLVLFSLMYFFELITNPVEKKLLLLGSFWLNTSVIIYFSGTFIFWAGFNYLLNHHKNILIHLSWIFDNFFDPFHYFLLGLALLLHIKRKKLE